MLNLLVPHYGKPKTVIKIHQTRVHVWELSDFEGEITKVQDLGLHWVNTYNSYTEKLETLQRITGVKSLGIYKPEKMLALSYDESFRVLEVENGRSH